MDNIELPFNNCAVAPPNKINGLSASCAFLTAHTMKKKKKATFWYILYVLPDKNAAGFRYLQSTVSYCHDLY